jgi:cytochrome c553
MKHSIAMLIVSILGIGGILYTTIINAEVSGYGDVHGCGGECYKEYTVKYGTFTEQLEAKRVAMQTETPADKGAKIYVNCNMCHGMKGEGGIGPKLSGSTSIVKMLMQYKNGETRGAQSALMWGQAANLSSEDMKNLQAYINTL